MLKCMYVRHGHAVPSLMRILCPPTTLCFLSFLIIASFVPVCEVFLSPLHLHFAWMHAFLSSRRKGSAILRFVKDQEDRSAVRQRFWELAGTTLGSLLQTGGEAGGAGGEKKMTGAPEGRQSQGGSLSGGQGGGGGKEQSVGLGETERKKRRPWGYGADEGGEECREELRQQNQFASALKDSKAQATSVFARTQTIDEQRKSLPVYTVRSDFLEVVREHQVWWM